MHIKSTTLPDIPNELWTSYIVPNFSIFPTVNIDNEYFAIEASNRTCKGLNFILKEIVENTYKALIKKYPIHLKHIEISHETSTTAKLENIFEYFFYLNNDLAPRELTYANCLQKVEELIVQTKKRHSLHIWKDLAKKYEIPMPAINGDALSLDKLNAQFTCWIVQNQTTLEILAELNLANTGLCYLPPSICYLPNLKTLHLQQNAITELPKEIEKLSSLESLDISGNPIRELPAELGELPSLEVLNIARTAITTIPKEVDTIENLTIKTNKRKAQLLDGETRSERQWSRDKRKKVDQK